MAGMLALRGRDRSRMEMVDGAMVARGPLADAFSTQLAVTQPPMAAVRMNISYRDRAGSYCRVFNTRSVPALSGVACRRGNEWQLQMLAASPGEEGARSVYQQAGSGISGTVLTLVQSQVSGDPLDGESEARAARSGWR